MRRRDETPEFDFDAVEVPHDQRAGESPASGLEDFDVDELVALGASVDGHLQPTSSWQEVPQARFLSWTDAEQQVYMAARDYDSAEHADDEWWCQFYLERAKTWRAA